MKDKINLKLDSGVVRTHMSKERMINIKEGLDDKKGSEPACTTMTQSSTFNHSRWEMLKIWSWQTGQRIRAIEGLSDLATCLNYNEELLASGNWVWIDPQRPLGTDKLHHAELIQEEFVLKGYAAQVQSISFFEKDLYLVSGSFDNCLKVWNLNDDNDDVGGV
ncbi:hypothetical protein BY996DRAFT_6445381 [Phakopsora pachyrhizi]|nr:hypothetical protein BY996DRAFT_6445381 [Phakopsora pachyrhizi]